MTEKPITRHPHRVTLRLTDTTLAFAVADETAAGGLDYEPYVMKSGMSPAANLREAFIESRILGAGFLHAQVLVDSPVLLVPLEEFDATTPSPSITILSRGTRTRSSSTPSFLRRTQWRSTRSTKTLSSC